MFSVILLAGIRSPVIGEIKNCSLAVGAAAAGLGAEVQDNKYTYNVHTHTYTTCIIIWLQKYLHK